MLTTLLVLLPAGLVLAVLLLASRCSRVSAAGGPPVSPARPEPAGGTAVPVIEVQPSDVMTEPFAYDNGVKSGERDREAARP